MNSNASLLFNYATVALLTLLVLLIFTAGFYLSKYISTCRHKKFKQRLLDQFSKLELRIKNLTMQVQAERQRKGKSK